MNNINKFIVFAFVSAFLCSCGIYGKYQSVTAEEAEQVRIPSYTEIFREPELLSLIDTALANNLDLKIAHLRVQQADAVVKAAKLAYLPRLFAGAQPAVSLAAFKSDGNTVRDWSYTFGTASWEIDIFGRLTNQKRIAQVNREQLADYEQAARVELIAAVATLYYNLQVLDAQIEATDAAEQNWEKSVYTMKEMKKAGLNDEAAVSQFEGSYYSTKAASKALRLLRTQAENAMLLILCKEDGAILRGKLNPQTDNSIIESIDLRVLRTRPDVNASEMNLASAFYNANLARANCCPSINIGGTIGWANGSVIYNAVGGLLQPLFNAGQNILAVRVSKSKLEEAEMAYTNSLLTAGNEVNDALAARKSYIDRVDDYSKRVESMTRALDATQFKMSLGRGTYLEVLNAQNELLDAQMSMIENSGNILISAVDLYHAIGGGK